MKNLLPVFFASIAAIGNAMFALGQKKSTGVGNGLIFIGMSAVVAVLFALLFAPLVGAFEMGNTIKGNCKAIVLSGLGLFLTYLGMNLLYARFGVSQYVLYAALAIISTTIIVGILWLKEPVNVYHKIAIALAMAAVVFFAVGQSGT